MKIGVIQFPGSNCERETKNAIHRAGMEPIEFLWNEDPNILEQMAGFVIVGGFSYEDRSRAGIIAALDPVMKQMALESEKGKPVLGICNGAQILVETGLVPGVKNNQVAMALSENKRIKDGKVLGTGFYNSWINICLGPNILPNAFTRHLTKDSILTIPIAHAEGRFLMSETLLNTLKDEGLQAFQYCDEQGRIIDNFPVNPNGSMHNLAAVMNTAGNVMAIMPHPERTTVGDAIFSSMRDYILENKKRAPASISYAREFSKPQVYKKKSGHHQLIVQLSITDNQALTVQNTLRQLGLNLEVTRLVHWEIDSPSEDMLKKIMASGILYNERKEYLVTNQTYQGSDRFSYLVRPQEDLLGREKLQMLEDHFSISKVNSIFYGILWIFKSLDNKMEDLKENILKTNIIFNPYSHDCYDYE